jgi:hypothetical protein
MILDLRELENSKKILENDLNEKLDEMQDIKQKFESNIRII